MDMHTSTSTLAVVAAVLSGSFASAAVVTNPAIVTGSDALDPAGLEEVNTAYGATQAQLETGTFGAIQDFTGFTPGSSPNIIDFTSGARPDVRFTLTGNLGSNAGGATTDPVLMSSQGAGVQLVAGVVDGDQTLTVEFGTYDASTTTFTTGASVGSVGFVLNGHRTGIEYKVSFYNSAGVQVGSTVTTAGANESPHYTDVSVGYLWDGTTANAVSKVVIFRDASTRGTTSQGLDDFGFALVPEPSALTLIGAGALALLRRRRAAIGKAIVA
jgi:hypothetical protein